MKDDPKFDEFAAHLDVWLKADTNPGRRLVVFSESAETVFMLRDRLVALGRGDVLAVSAATKGDEEIAIRRNFDANYPSPLKEDSYRILIATDVLAEGVNLHRANTVVNYDTPWNSVRMFQRVGRVNRVGGLADKVYIYNFFPLAKVDDEIELKKKAEMKLQAFHSAFGEDAAIYSPDKEVGHFGLYGGAGLEDEGPSQGTPPSRAAAPHGGGAEPIRGRFPIARGPAMPAARPIFVTRLPGHAEKGYLLFEDRRDSRAHRPHRGRGADKG